VILNLTQTVFNKINPNDEFINTLSPQGSNATVVNVGGPDTELL
jgi:hypothetical protein